MTLITNIGGPARARIYAAGLHYQAERRTHLAAERGAAAIRLEMRRAAEAQRVVLPRLAATLDSEYRAKLKATDPVFERTDRCKRILAEVAERHGVTVKDIKGPCRFTFVALARREAYYRLHAETDLSLAQIGAMLAKDHTSVGHGIRKYLLGALAAGHVVERVDGRWRVIENSNGPRRPEGDWGLGESPPPSFPSNETIAAGSLD